ncbi:TPA: carbohydrate kinase [Klebsiella pneumoniae]|nr:carbohydrate kinase [Klebsiella pneumoniae]
MKMKKVACVGELLIDFVCSDIDANLFEGNNFLKKAGGAPANVACAVSRLGGEAKLAAKVGNDPFGQFLIDTVKNEKVDTTSVIVDNNLHTTLAFVALEHNGERDFSFIWGAHDKLQYVELGESFLDDTCILHLGAALVDSDIINLYRELIISAKNKNILICFDPNFRDALWHESKHSRFIVLSREFISHTDIVKLSEEEALMISGKTTIDEAAETIADLGVKLVLITLGSSGTLMRINGTTSIIPTVKIDAIDSTGAGDAFIGGLLYQISQDSSILNSTDKLKECVSFANKVGALTCNKMGAISALPTIEQVSSFYDQI